MVWWSGIGSSAGFSLIRQTHSKPRWWRGRGVEDAISFCLWAHRRVIIEENRSRLVVKDFRLLCRSDASLPSIGLPIGMESRSKLWLKVKLALRYIYDHHINDFDWFFKADDDTWVILLHGCSLILEKNSLFTQLYDCGKFATLSVAVKCITATIPWAPFFVWRFQLQLLLRWSGLDDFLNVTLVVKSWFWIASLYLGYLLTRETLRRFVEVGLNQNACQTKPEEQDEDVNIGIRRFITAIALIWGHSWYRICLVRFHLGRCVGKLGAIFQNSRDHWGRQRFIPYHLDEFFRGKGHNMDFLRTRDGDGLRLVLCPVFFSLFRRVQWCFFIACRVMTVAPTKLSLSIMFLVAKCKFTNILFTKSKSSVLRRWNKRIIERPQKSSSIQSDFSNLFSNLIWLSSSQKLFFQLKYLNLEIVSYGKGCRSVTSSKRIALVDSAGEVSHSNLGE